MVKAGGIDGEAGTVGLADNPTRGDHEARMSRDEVAGRDVRTRGWHGEARTAVMFMPLRACATVTSGRGKRLTA